MRQKRNKKVIGAVLAELDANAGHLSQTSREQGIPVTTLWTWREHYKNDPIVERYRSLKNEELADRFRVISALATERLFHEIDDVSVDKLATVAAIGADKQLLLTGQSTDIEKMLTGLVSRLQKDLPDIAESELRAYIAESIGIKELGAIG